MAIISNMSSNYAGFIYILNGYFHLCIHILKYVCMYVCMEIGIFVCNKYLSLRNQKFYRCKSSGFEK